MKWLERVQLRELRRDLLQHVNLRFVFVELPQGGSRKGCLGHHALGQRPELLGIALDANDIDADARPS